MVCVGPIGIMIRINQLLKDLFETTGENEYGGDIRWYWGMAVNFVKWENLLEIQAEVFMDERIGYIGGTDLILIRLVECGWFNYRNWVMGTQTSLYAYEWLKLLLLLKLYLFRVVDH